MEVGVVCDLLVNELALARADTALARASLFEAVVIEGVIVLSEAVRVVMVEVG
jgi:hypothetical protein